MFSYKFSHPFKPFFSVFPVDYDKLPLSRLAKMKVLGWRSSILVNLIRYSHYKNVKSGLSRIIISDCSRCRDYTKMNVILKRFVYTEFFDESGLSSTSC